MLKNKRGYYLVGGGMHLPCKNFNYYCRNSLLKFIIKLFIIKSLYKKTTSLRHTIFMPSNEGQTLSI